MKIVIRPLLKNKNFLYLWLSQLSSQIAVNTLTFLIILRVFQATGSTIASSLVWVTFIVPAIVFGPFAAAVTDIFDRKTILMVTNLMQAVIIFAYAFLFTRYLFLSYGIVFIYAFFNLFYIPAELASVPRLVKEKDLPFANGLSLLTYQVGIILGYGISGAFSLLVGFRTSFLLASGLLFFALASVSLLPTIKPHKDSKNLEKGASAFFVRVFEGYYFIKENKDVLLAFILVVSLQVALAIMMVNLPIMAREIVRVEPSLAGLFIVLPAGLGAAIGALFIPRLLGKWRKKTLIENSLLLLSFVILVVAIFVPEIAVFARPLIAPFFFLAAGMLFVGVFIPAQTYLQIVTPSDLMGRVFGNTWFITTAATVLPVLFSATITELFGIRQLLLVMGVLTLTLFAFSKRFGNNWIMRGNYE